MMVCSLQDIGDDRGRHEEEKDQGGAQDPDVDRHGWAWNTQGDIVWEAGRQGNGSRVFRLRVGVTLHSICFMEICL